MINILIRDMEVFEREHPSAIAFLHAARLRREVHNHLCLLRSRGLTMMQYKWLKDVLHPDGVDQPARLLDALKEPWFQDKVSQDTGRTMDEHLKNRVWHG